MVTFDGLRTFEAMLVFKQDLLESRISNWDSERTRNKYNELEAKLVLLNAIRELMDEQ